MLRAKLKKDAEAKAEAEAVALGGSGGLSTSAPDSGGEITAPVPTEAKEGDADGAGKIKLIGQIGGIDRRPPATVGGAKKIKPAEIRIQKGI
jgi:hypothetical protein